eukprot:SAG22_NODE_867_length_6776_cov_2.480455_6_plen_188_part_00
MEPALGGDDLNDLNELMAGMFGQVAVAVDGEARGGAAAIVAARRRQAAAEQQQQLAEAEAPGQGQPVGAGAHPAATATGAGGGAAAAALCTRTVMTPPATSQRKQGKTPSPPAAAPNGRAKGGGSRMRAHVAAVDVAVDTGGAATPPGGGVATANRLEAFWARQPQTVHRAAGDGGASQAVERVQAD